MIRGKLRILCALLVVMLFCTAFSTNAFAFSDVKTDGVLEFWDENAVRPSETATVETGNTITQTGEPLSVGSEFFTRDLLYNKDTHKQFITVEGRDGNIFYIVIDYDAPVNEDEEQYMTYFLNKVDEADLSALVEQGEPAVCICTNKCHAGAVNMACPVCSTNMAECAGREPEPELTPEPDTESKPEAKTENSANVLMPVVLVVALAGGGAVYFLKFRKKKPDTKGNADLEDYDYGNEDEYEDGGTADEGDE